MGITSENVASTFGISRDAQDRFALESFSKAMKAQQAGYFQKEIIPVHTSITDESNKKIPITVTNDDGIRPTTLESLARLKPSFRENGCSTAGNSSQISDGAAAVVLMKRGTAVQLALPVLAVFRSFAVCGVPPHVMGIGPAVAIPEALRQAGVKQEDIDVFEINEAFASQALYCIDKLNIPMNKVNPNGGAIALGHPLGCTGVRQIVTLIPELQRRKGTYGIVSMCIGTGMGAAAVFELEA